MVIVVASLSESAQRPRGAGKIDEHNNIGDVDKALIVIHPCTSMNCLLAEAWSMWTWLRMNRSNV